MSGVECGSECTFPKFLISAMDEETGLLKPWKTKTHWFQISTNPQIQQLSEIYVTGSDMWQIRQEFYRTCESKSRRLSNKITSSERCGEKTLSYNRTCLTVDSANETAGLYTYRLLEQHVTGTKYVCMSFQRRSEGVVTVRKGPINGRNVPRLCDNDKMVFDEWPWIATWKPSAYTCPISGGFSLRVISGLTMKDTCENEWRNSSVEVECSKGGGIVFIAPVKSECNPFSKTSSVTTLHCWAGWKQRNFTYMIVSAQKEADYHNEPQFCIRFPNTLSENFEAFVYVSVICPTDRDGLAPPGINYFKLKMRKINNAVCQDDNEVECSKLKDSGMCDHPKTGFYRHCLKTCGECDENSASRKTCSFSSKLYGKWKLIERNRFEKVVINSSHVDFSEMGAFQCYQRTPDEHQYTVTTAYNNGCSNRYSCIELERLGNNILRYRIGPSVRENQPYESLCQFRDDEYPLLDTYRSSARKTLIYDDGLLFGSYCGFEGRFMFNGTYGGRQCLGMISDVDPKTCNTVTTLTVHGKDCQGINEAKQYQCLQYIYNTSSLFEKYLITKSKDEAEEYNCWVKYSTFEYKYDFPQQVIYKMPTPQCGMFTNVLAHHDRQADAELFLKVKEPCQTRSNVKNQPTVNSSPSTVPYQPDSLGAVVPIPQTVDSYYSIASRFTQCTHLYLVLVFCSLGQALRQVLR
ncbi:uncharacterized protein LOC133193099 [Saccostrea echinata]|uniref:uncharacterized protein LOC133193099 n=1 Tax=Saccostrea echinata TaxID=191078 RepID=UPI002A7EF534|nr:uncharacterized protein LOC133193099 [Saccostrea echinata]